MKIVINSCYGGFSLSDEAMAEYAKLIGWKVVRSAPNYEGDKGFCLITDDLSLPDVITNKQWNSRERKIKSSYDFERNDPILVQVVEKLGSKKASGECAELRIVDTPDGISWEIDEYDGIESVEETHRKWY